jgi:hypothetical protein
MNLASEYYLKANHPGERMQGALIYLVPSPIQCVQQENDSLALNGNVSTQLHNSFMFIMLEVQFSSIFLKGTDYW